MKISVLDLQKALEWVKKNSNEDKINISIDEHHESVIITTFDRFSAKVTMSLPLEGRTYAKITRTEDL